MGIQNPYEYEIRKFVSSDGKVMIRHVIKSSDLKTGQRGLVYALFVHFGSSFQAMALKPVIVVCSSFDKIT